MQGDEQIMQGDQGEPPIVHPQDPQQVKMKKVKSEQIVHPQPPYTQADDAKLKEGLSCYYPHCSFKPSHSYGSILQHVKSFHKRPLKQLRGSYLHTQGTKDFNAKQIVRRGEQDPQQV